MLFAVKPNGPRPPSQFQNPVFNSHVLHDTGRAHKFGYAEGSPISIVGTAEE